MKHVLPHSSLASVSLVALVCICLALTGCGGSSLGTVPVEGSVMIDGKPIAGITVVFSPDSGGRAASGQTDESGNYKLTTEINGDGALPGTYKVTISKVEVEEDTLPETVDPNSAESMDAIYGALDTKKEPKSKNLVAKKYANAATSGLTATVNAEGENKFPFEVTSK